MTEPKCENCKWWCPDSGFASDPSMNLLDALGECRKNAPSHATKTVEWTAEIEGRKFVGAHFHTFPPVYPGDWCGEFTPKGG